MRRGTEYIAIPETGSGTGVCVLHSWWGLNDFFKGFCDRLAHEGFVALAPDLYGGEVATTIEAAKKLRARATASRKEPAYRILMRAIRDLAGHEATTQPRIGLIGFSMGGHWAFWLSQRPELPIAATVTFYAARSGDFARSCSAFLGHFAERDDWVSPASIKKLRKHLDAAGKTAVFHSYPGTTHWFFEGDRSEAFNPGAAALAWQRTVSFLRAQLALTRTL